ncbi:unnamed protein product [Orchesella dallaii]|uniref:DNA repair protein RAD51 homolog 3 n=1 Tax=Orchesella dallaii TaxID=48710 RepID=A0ABP1Q9W5_9HEXA
MSSATWVSAKQMLDREKHVWYRPIPTFVQPFDKILNGGIKLGVITEIVGDCGTGKTCMCYQLCLNVQIPLVLQGLESQALFIDTENSFVSARMKEMTEAFVHHCNSVLHSGHSSKLSEHRVLSRIHVIKCKDLSTFEKVILHLDAYLAKNRKIKVIAIDSIAFPFYSQGDGFWERGKLLYSIGQILHYLADKYGIAVVLTNNVTTRFDQSGNEYFVPFLGDSWNYIPNQRINLRWGNDRRRVAEIVKSSYAAAASVNFRITPMGIRE